MNIKRKDLNCEFKAAGDDGSFELYALAFNNIDRQGDLIVPGAVSNVDEFIKDGWGASNHLNSSLPVAYPESGVQDAKGLLVRGRFHTTQAAQDCRTVVTERMAAGKTVPCSIGYAVDDASYETRGGEEIRVLKSIRVYEFSFVNLPANPAASVVSAKSLEREPMDDTERGLIAALKRAVGLDTKKGKVISAANHSALTGHADAMTSCLKSIKAAHKDMDDAVGDFKSFLDAHAPASADDGDGDEGKAADSLLQLRLRALEGRRMIRCP